MRMCSSTPALMYRVKTLHKGLCNPQIHLLLILIHILLYFNVLSSGDRDTGDPGHVDHVHVGLWGKKKKHRSQFFTPIIFIPSGLCNTKIILLLPRIAASTRSVWWDNGENGNSYYTENGHRTPCCLRWGIGKSSFSHFNTYEHISGTLSCSSLYLIPDQFNNNVYRAAGMRTDEVDKAFVSLIVHECISSMCLC